MICYSEVRFLGKNGYEGELKKACECLKIGKAYAVLRIDIEDFHTSITIWVNNEPKVFNSVMFEGCVGSEI